MKTDSSERVNKRSETWMRNRTAFARIDAWWEDKERRYPRLFRWLYWITGQGDER